MFRILIGSLLGGLVQFIVGAIAWVSPLGSLAYVGTSDAVAADLQAAMARTLTPTGTGTYFIPSPETAEGTVMLGKGPVALVMFNASGHPVMDPAALVTGLIMSIVTLFLIGIALSGLPNFAARMRALVLVAAAFTLYFVLALPVYNIYMPWAWWIFLAAECFVAVLAGGFVMLRWFMPAAASAPVVVEQPQEPARSVEIPTVEGSSL